MQFRRSKPQQSIAEPAADEAQQPDARDPQAPKGRPTPRRSDSAKQRVYDHAPVTRKEAAVLQRQRRAESQERARQGMERGDERYMLPRDRGPARRLARDTVDARLNFGTLVLPAAVLVLLSALIQNPVVYGILNTAWLGLMILAAFDWLFVFLKLNRRVEREHPGERRGFGLFWYVMSRSLMPRRWRQPKPQIRLGEPVV